MNRTFAIAALGLAFLLFGLVGAEANNSSVTKIGYVDLQRTLNETKAGKAAKARLEKNKLKKQKALDKQQQDLQKFAADLEKQRSLLKRDVQIKRERELQERYVKLQETYMKLQQELAQQEAKLVREIFNKAAPVIKQIAKQKGYTMILEKNESAVLYAPPSLDITAEVNKRIK
jgi:outer membrane protein